MEKLKSMRKQLSPRRQSLIAVMVPYGVFAVAVALFPIHLALIPVAITAIGAGVFRLLQKCASCGTSLARVPINIFGVKLSIYTPLAPRHCPNGHNLERSE
jgi:uncharacterized membrane-anchored protein YitT (DUF2179 family)